MSHTIMTRQFQAGNSQAVRLPAEIAFPPKTELRLVREGDVITVQPVEKTMADLPDLFASLKKHTHATPMLRPEFVETERDWATHG